MGVIRKLEPAREHRVLTVLLLAVFFVAVAYGMAGAAVIEAIQERDLRCYPIVPPLMRHEKSILEGENFMCSAELCRLVGRLLPDNGLVCFFPRPQLIRSS